MDRNFHTFFFYNPFLLFPNAAYYIVQQSPPVTPLFTAKVNVSFWTQRSEPCRLKDTISTLSGSILRFKALLYSAGNTFYCRIKVKLTDGDRRRKIKKTAYGEKSFNKGSTPSSSW